MNRERALGERNGLRTNDKGNEDVDYYEPGSLEEENQFQKREERRLLSGVYNAVAKSSEEEKEEFKSIQRFRHLKRSLKDLERIRDYIDNTGTSRRAGAQVERAKREMEDIMIKYPRFRNELEEPEEDYVGGGQKQSMPVDPSLDSLFVPDFSAEAIVKRVRGSIEDYSALDNGFSESFASAPGFIGRLIQLSSKISAAFNLVSTKGGESRKKTILKLDAKLSKCWTRLIKLTDLTLYLTRRGLFPLETIFSLHDTTSAHAHISHDMDSDPSQIMDLYRVVQKMCVISLLRALAVLAVLTPPSVHHISFGDEFPTLQEYESSLVMESKEAGVDKDTLNGIIKARIISSILDQCSRFTSAVRVGRREVEDEAYEKGLDALRALVAVFEANRRVETVGDGSELDDPAFGSIGGIDLPELVASAQRALVSYNEEARNVAGPSIMISGREKMTRDAEGNVVEEESSPPSEADEIQTMMDNYFRPGGRFIPPPSSPLAKSGFVDMGPDGNVEDLTTTTTTAATGIGGNWKNTYITKKKSADGRVISETVESHTSDGDNVTTETIIATPPAPTIIEQSASETTSAVTISKYEIKEKGYRSRFRWYEKNAAGTAKKIYLNRAANIPTVVEGTTKENATNWMDYYRGLRESTHFVTAFDGNDEPSLDANDDEDVMQLVRKPFDKRKTAVYYRERMWKMLRRSKYQKYWAQFDKCFKLWIELIKDGMIVVLLREGGKRSSSVSKEHPIPPDTYPDKWLSGKRFINQAKYPHPAAMFYFGGLYRKCLDGQIFVYGDRDHALAGMLPKRRSKIRNAYLNMKYGPSLAAYINRCIKLYDWSITNLKPVLLLLREQAAQIPPNLFATLPEEQEAGSELQQQEEEEQQREDEQQPAEEEEGEGEETETVTEETIVGGDDEPTVEPTTEPATTTTTTTTTSSVESRQASVGGGFWNRRASTKTTTTRDPETGVLTTTTATGSRDVESTEEVTTGGGGGTAEEHIARMKANGYPLTKKQKKSIKIILSQVGTARISPNDDIYLLYRKEGDADDPEGSYYAPEPSDADSMRSDDLVMAPPSGYIRSNADDGFVTTRRVRISPLERTVYTNYTSAPDEMLRKVPTTDILYGPSMSSIDPRQVTEADGSIPDLDVGYVDDFLMSMSVISLEIAVAHKISNGEMEAPVMQTVLSSGDEEEAEGIGSKQGGGGDSSPIKVKDWVNGFTLGEAQAQSQRSVTSRRTIGGKQASSTVTTWASIGEKVGSKILVNLARAMCNSIMERIKLLFTVYEILGPSYGKSMFKKDRQWKVAVQPADNFIVGIYHKLRTATAQYPNIEQVDKILSDFTMVCLIDPGVDGKITFGAPHVFMVKKAKVDRLLEDEGFRETEMPPLTASPIFRPPNGALPDKQSGYYNVPEEFHLACLRDYGSAANRVLVLRNEADYPEGRFTMGNLPSSPELDKYTPFAGRNAWAEVGIANALDRKDDSMGCVIKEKHSRRRPWDDPKKVAIIHSAELTAWESVPLKSAGARFVEGMNIVILTMIPHGLTDGDLIGRLTQ